MSQADLGARGFVLLVALSAISTLAALMVFRRFSSGAPMGRAANRIIAHLMELGLFFDDPALVFRAQRDLLRENLKMLRIIAMPCALLAIPFVIFLAALDSTFGRAPLVVGAPAVVTVQWSGAAPKLSVPQGIHVETPPVRIVSSGEISWRIRPIQKITGALKIALGGGVFSEKIVAGPGLVYGFPFPAARVRIPYPRATILHLHWILWYILTAGATAFAWNLF